MSVTLPVVATTQAETTLGPVGRWTRIGAALLGLLLLIAGTLFGQDDDFPAAPFRMYSTTDDLDAPVRSLRVEGVTVDGERLVLKDSDTGLRRAEIEGQQERIKADPALLDAVAEAYHARNPSEPRLREVDVVVRLIQLRDGRPTGVWQDTTTVRRVVA